MDIAAWLDGLGLGQYEQAFRVNEIDERVLPSLTSDDLREIGVVPVGGIGAIGRAKNKDRVNDFATAKL